MRIKLIPILLILVLTAGGVFAATKVGWIGDNATPSSIQNRPSQSQAHRPTASAVYDTSCASSEAIKKKIPVLLVHGWNGRPLQWGNSKDLSGIYGALTDLPVITTAFDYRDYNQSWVTHPGIGSALSQKINCLSDASKAGGGKGKVIVVAHSMGGLATKRALALGDSGKNVDLVFTLGTPYEGSGFGSIADDVTRDYCRRVNPHSSECLPKAFEGLREFNPLIEALPDWPSHTGVMAIGGDVKTRFPEVELGGDTIVSTSSAQAGGQNPRNGGGQLIYHCRGDALAPGDAACAHGNLPNYRPIQEQIKRSIARYIDELNGKTISYAGLTLQVPASWKVIEKSDEALGVSDPGCGSDPCEFYIYSPKYLPCMATSPQKVLMCDEETKLDYERTVTVGGVKAFAYRFNGYTSDDNWWFIPSKHVAVSGDVNGLAKILENARWN